MARCDRAGSGAARRAAAASTHAHKGDALGVVDERARAVQRRVVRVDQRVDDRHARAGAHQRHHRVRADVARAARHQHVAHGGSGHTGASEARTHKLSEGRLEMSATMYVQLVNAQVVSHSSVTQTEKQYFKDFCLYTADRLVPEDFCLYTADRLVPD